MTTNRWSRHWRATAGCVSAAVAALAVAFATTGAASAARKIVVEEPMGIVNDQNAPTAIFESTAAAQYSRAEPSTRAKSNDPSWKRRAIDT